MLLSRRSSIKFTEDQANFIGHMCYAASKLWNVCNYERYHYKELGLESKNPFQIGCTDGIIVFQIMFSYGLRSKCADLRNSYNSHSKKPLYFSLINW